MSHETLLGPRPVLAMDLLAKHFPGMRTKHAFACESDAKKRLFISRMFPSLDSLFVNVFNLNGERSVSSKTAGAVEVRQVPSVTLFVCGFSCTSISPLNPHSKQHRAAGFKSSSQTASTYQGQLKYIKKHRPLIVINENVESLNWASSDTSSEGTPTSMLDQVLQTYRRIGYKAMYKLTNPIHLGMPQSRPRYYIMAFDSDALEHADLVLARAAEVVEQLHTNSKNGTASPCIYPLRSFLLPEAGSPATCRLSASCFCRLWQAAMQQRHHPFTPLSRCCIKGRGAEPGLVAVIHHGPRVGLQA
jgi:site-specific DNA-cytosine methylase